MQNTSVLISGASIAGPALASWLTRCGFAVTVVEKAPAVRPGGQAVDVKGKAHRTVLGRMGILDDVMAARTHPRDGTIVDAAGRTLAVMPSELSAGEIEIPRGDLAQLIHQQTATRCEYLFDDSVTSLTEAATGVEVTFARAAPRTFDLVVGADGIHSTVRRLAFGPESDHVRHLGYHYALADIDLDDQPDGADQMYNEPGRMATTGGPKAPAFFVFASPPLDHDRDDVAQQKAALVHAYRGAGWRVPELLARIPDATEFHLDSISRVTTDHYVTGRVALLGDSAWGNTLGGFGTGFALVGAYVLAGELARADGDHTTALARYQSSMRDYTRTATTVNSGRLLAPRTKLGIAVRNRMFSAAALFRPLMTLADHLASDIDLQDYAFTELPNAYS